MKFLIEVVNLKNSKADFNCDRKSVLGNPFKMKNPSDEERDRVCGLFEDNFDPTPEQLSYLRKIWAFGTKNGKVSIGCHCYPKRCHCDTIKDWLEGHMN